MIAKPTKKNQGDGSGQRFETWSPTTRVSRLLNLHWVLCREPNITIIELQNYFGVSRRTVFRDIRTLRDAKLDPRAEDRQSYAAPILTNSQWSALKKLFWHLSEISDPHPQIESAHEALGMILDALGPGDVVGDRSKSIASSNRANTIDYGMATDD
ncbi:MAG: HTH domain-containing protein [Planctomycetota bacterium]